MDERKRVKDILDKAEAEMFRTESYEPVAGDIPADLITTGTITVNNEVVEKLKTLAK